jgi:hypothetical protein
LRMFYNCFKCFFRCFCKRFRCIFQVFHLSSDKCCISRCFKSDRVLYFPHRILLPHLGVSSSRCWLGI